MRSQEILDCAGSGSGKMTRLRLRLGSNTFCRTKLFEPLAPTPDPKKFSGS